MHTPPDQAAATSMAEPEPLLAARGVGVRFGSVRALDGVDFTLRAGEIHALMGENGAGKSTLIKALTGVHRIEAGSIRLEGREVRPASPRHAAELGIATVYQEIGLIAQASIAENICLGREPVRRGWPRLVNWGAVKQRARNALARLGLERLDATRPLGACSIAVQQLVAIARALDLRARVLILDEPTSSLDRRECERLFDVMRGLRAQGLGVIFVTHGLEQVEAVADRVTVLRDGRPVGVIERPPIDRVRLVSMMVGRAFERVPTAAAEDTGRTADASPTMLAVRSLSRRGTIESVDLSIGTGEAVGLAGLLGSGRSETARAIFGADPADGGTITVDGETARITSPRDAIARGIAMTPENRKADGVVPTLSVRENIVLALQARRGLLRRIGGREQRRLATAYIASLGIKTPDAETPIASLSGGNQQKALIARWLAIQPRVLILDEPTRGIDVNAKAEILRAVHEMRARGMAVLFISSELEEVVRACGRVVVLRDRRSVAELRGAEITEERVLSAVAGDHA